MKTQLNTGSTQAESIAPSRKKTKAKSKSAKAPLATESNGSDSRPTYQAVASRAHAIWMAQGCPEGREKEHWQQAEEELMNGAGAMSEQR
jgi:hypothetical protein